MSRLYFDVANMSTNWIENTRVLLFKIIFHSFSEEMVIIQANMPHWPWTKARVKQFVQEIYQRSFELKLICSIGYIFQKILSITSNIRICYVLFYFLTSRNTCIKRVIGLELKYLQTVASLQVCSVSEQTARLNLTPWWGSKKFGIF